MSQWDKHSLSNWDQLETNTHNVEHAHSSTRIQFEMLEAKRDTDGRPRQRPQWQWNRLSAAAAVAAVLACAAAILFAMQIRGVEVGHAHAIEASLEHKLAAMEVRLEQQSEQQLVHKYLCMCVYIYVHKYECTHICEYTIFFLRIYT